MGTGVSGLGGGEGNRCGREGGWEGVEWCSQMDGWTDKYKSAEGPRGGGRRAADVDA